MMNRRKVVFIIHFQPIELFPPVLNMIDFFGKEKEIELFVSANRKLKENVLKDYENQNVKIYRPGHFSKSRLLQYFNYFSYYFSTLVLLLWHKPNVVLYIETLSSWPALIYKKIRGKKVKLMVHYHEYTEPARYDSGMLLSRIMHKMEKKMYSRFSWISHTNPVRMQMFKNDCNLNDIDNEVFKIIPNYPSRSWLKNETINIDTNRIKKMVFVGSLGYKNMYLQEMIDFLDLHSDEFSLDVYSYNIDNKAKTTLLECKNKNIKFFGGCDYHSLPEILKTYDIGLVIYKPFSLNTINAVSNKVFEYLACGLDVWYSSDMTYTHEYERLNFYPKIVSVDFTELNSFDYKNALNHENLPFKASEYFYENIYPQMVDHFLDEKFG